MVSGFMSSDGGYLGDPVVNPHEVGVFSELGDNFARTDPLSLTCYHCDRHEALLRSSVYPVGDLIQSLDEVSDEESLLEMFAPFVLLLAAVTSGVLIVSSFIGGRALADTLSFEMWSRYQSGRVSKGPMSPATTKTW
jgi:hypothetical protein